MLRRRGRSRAALVATLASCTLTAAQSQGPPPAPSPHQVTSYGLVYHVPLMDQIEVRADIPYKSVDGATLGMDLYLPPLRRAGDRLPVIVFLNTAGDRPGNVSMKTWGQYTTWPRLAAARGYAGIAFSSRASDPVSDARDLLAWVTSHADELGLDPDRIGVWACSAHVLHALPALMTGRMPQAKAAALFYGAADIGSFRKDLPVLLVRAGRDRPFINEQIDKVTSAAATANAPWTVVNAAGLHHGFDCLDDLDESRRIILDTMAWFDRHLRPVPFPRAKRSLALEALSYWFAQEYSEAAEAYGRYVKANPDDLFAINRLGTAQIYAKKYEDSIRTFESLRAKGARDAAVSYNIACAYALMGDKDKAMSSLEQAVAEGFDNAQGLQEDPDLASLRGDARFAELQDRLAPK
ncbi:MAG: TPR end-of-group domain-containing protein [Candidatus Polarisedimenticolia bacterium]